MHCKLAVNWRAVKYLSYNPVNSATLVSMKCGISDPVASLLETWINNLLLCSYFTQEETCWPEGPREILDQYKLNLESSWILSAVLSKVSYFSLILSIDSGFFKFFLTRWEGLRTEDVTPVQFVKPPETDCNLWFWAIQKYIWLTDWLIDWLIDIFIIKYNSL